MISNSLCHHYNYSLLLLLLLQSTAIVRLHGEVVEDKYSSKLFEPSENITVIAPTAFAKPTYIFDDPTITVIAEPTYGKHRHNVDAVLAYAEGYTLEYYRFFLETLQDTGFTGDVVLAIADTHTVFPNVVDYLKTYSDNYDYSLPDAEQTKMNVVIYQYDLVCYDYDGKSLIGRRQKSGALDIFQQCRLDNVYGWRDPSTNKVINTTVDARGGRVVATLRYEWYWIWTLQYSPHSWLLLIDSRDSFFQSNPFAHVPRTPANKKLDEDSGYLYFFGENSEATRLGASTKNRNWIKNGYGEKTLQAIAEKPTICSGSTMGEQIALETYLRAMVNEWDETDISMTGSDQGFHNYLYYSGKLHNAKSIKSLIVWEQGKGIINNLGAMRTKPLTEWGIYDNVTHKVYNWFEPGEEKVVSPVVHQWDRDKELNSHCQKNRMKPLKQWKK